MALRSGCLASSNATKFALLWIYNINYENKTSAVSSDMGIEYSFMSPKLKNHTIFIFLSPNGKTIVYD
jgi:hypothetical protein